MCPSILRCFFQNLYYFFESDPLPSLIYPIKKIVTTVVLNISSYLLILSLLRRCSLTVTNINRSLLASSWSSLSFEKRDKYSIYKTCDYSKMRGALLQKPLYPRFAKSQLSDIVIMLLCLTSDVTDNAVPCVLWYSALNVAIDNSILLYNEFFCVTTITEFIKTQWFVHYNWRSSSGDCKKS